MRGDLVKDVSETPIQLNFHVLAGPVTTAITALELERERHAMEQMLGDFTRCHRSELIHDPFNQDTSARRYAQLIAVALF